ncbi:MAG: lysophospholipid acyltransferase family protein [Planctomycetes bacterium]|nr:lysophospholipid acyltransferase family protein [Planctomycetota bacterium]
MRERLISFLAFWLIRGISLTISFKTINRSVREQCDRENKPFIYAFWHGRQFLLLGWNKDRNLMVMTSLSKDGRLQDNILTSLGFRTVAGSSSRGAVRGLVGMIRGIKANHNAVVSVDGPRGPLHRVKEGVIYLAAKTGSVIIPLTSRAKCRHIFEHAWDKYELPLPFTPALVIMGEAIRVPTDADGTVIEAKRLELENALNEITKKADSYYEI